MDPVDTYIHTFPAASQKRLGAVRAAIKAAAPILTEELKWGKVGYSHPDGVIMVVFAGYAQHVGLHLTATTIEAFKDKLKGYTLGASSMQLPHDKPLPEALVKELVRYRVKEYEEEGTLWR